ncbi:MAG TPA: S53 family peptidase [Terriglobales bacterium]|nr:S53 family peptidase [Terriglobales bacterium]
MGLRGPHAGASTSGARGEAALGPAPINAFDAVAYAIDQDLAPIVSESFGTCELNVTTAGAAAFEAEVLQGNVEGITMVNGSGDSGAADCDAKAEAEVSHGLAVHYPASIPEVTAVGGTEFDEGAQTDWGANAAQGGSAMGYIPEMVWNDHAAFAARGLARLASGGGGISVLYPQPLWQQGVSQASATQRLVPDIAFTASAFHDPYIVCSEAATPCTGAYPPASFTEIGGASAPTPMFAGILALLNQYRLSHGFATAPGLGNINPKLYALAQAGSGVWHDVTLGNNREPCTAGTPDCTSGVTAIGYCAGPGYDTVTGLGSLDAAQLAQQWDGTPATSAPGILVGACDPAATVSAGQTASFPVAVAASGGLSGTAQLSCTGAPAGAVCTVSPASVTLSGTSAAATVTVSTTAGSWAAPWGKLPNRRWPLGWGATLLILAASLYLAKRRHGPLATAASLDAVILAVALAACGGGSSGGTVTPPPPPNPATPAGSYTLTVTATSGSHAGSVNLGLTVN